MADPRERACASAKIGVAHFARAFNLCDDPAIPHCWPRQKRDEVERLLAQLIHLVEEGPIRPRAGAMAQDDRQFQRFMAKVHVEA